MASSKRDDVEEVDCSGTALIVENLLSPTLYPSVKSRERTSMNITFTVAITMIEARQPFVAERPRL